MMTTVDLADALAETPGAVRGILERWDSLDETIREHYAEELAWLLGLVRDRLADEPRGSAVRFRCLQAFADLSAMKAEIAEKLGVRLEDYAW